MKWTFFRRSDNDVRAAPRPVASKPAGAGGLPENRPFHAVEVVSSGPRCPAARAVEHHRFLSSERPPPLPLPGCTREETCVCRYRHHADRRHDSRRAADNVWGAQPAWPVERERRRTGGRRATDRPAGAGPVSLR